MGGIIVQEKAEKAPAAQGEKTKRAKTEDYPSEEELLQTEYSNSSVGIWGEAALFFNLQKKYFKKYNAVVGGKINADSYVLEGSYPATEKNYNKERTGKIKITVQWPNKKPWGLWYEQQKANPQLTFIVSGELTTSTQALKFAS